jgi:hypothetical protein
VTLEAAGRYAVADALSGYAGLLSGDADIDVPRIPVRLTTSVTTVTFGPFLKPAQATGICIVRDGIRLITMPFHQTRPVMRGQSIEVTFTLEVGP